MNPQPWTISDVDDTRTYLDGYSNGLKLGRVSTSVTCNPKTYNRTKLIIDFFSIVPFSTGTANSGLSALGRSAGT